MYKSEGTFEIQTVLPNDVKQGRGISQNGLLPTTFHVYGKFTNYLLRIKGAHTRPMFKLL